MPRAEVTSYLDLMRIASNMIDLLNAAAKEHSSSSELWQIFNIIINIQYRWMVDGNHRDFTESMVLCGKITWLRKEWPKTIRMDDEAHCDAKDKLPRKSNDMMLRNMRLLTVGVRALHSWDYFIHELICGDLAKTVPFEVRYAVHYLADKVPPRPAAIIACIVGLRPVNVLLVLDHAISHNIKENHLIVFANSFWQVQSKWGSAKSVRKKDKTG